MEIEKEIKNIDDEIQRLRIKKHDLTMRYISDNGLKDVLSNIRNSNISCKVTSFYFDKNDDIYVIDMDLMEKDFKKRLQKKHRMIDEAFKGIDDEFIIKNIRFMGAI